MDSKKTIEIEDLKRILPQRYPFLMIDRVIEASPKKVVAIKNVSINENFFEGHFPQKPIMPGVLIIEAMAQAAIVLYKEIFRNSRVVYLGAVKARIFDSAYPGNQIRIEVLPIKMFTSSGIVSATAMVNDKKIAKMEMTFSAKDE